MDIEIIRINARWSRMLRKPHCTCHVDDDGNNIFCQFHKFNTDKKALGHLYFGRFMSRKLNDEEFMREAS